MLPDKKTTAEKEALGRSRGGFSTKVHVCCDALGNPRRLVITAGQDSDYLQAEALLGEDKPLAVEPTKAMTAVAWCRPLKRGEQWQLFLPAQTQNSRA